MKSAYLGVPVLRRYDLLRKLLLSAEAGTLQPKLVVIVDNGDQPHKIAEAVRDVALAIEIRTPPRPLGVAASWNYLLARLPEERIIANDDITFTPDAVERMCSTSGDLVFGHGYSCYLLRDSAIEKIGLFDEAISPDYAYWEDIDYDTRIRLFVADGGAFLMQNAPCEVLHAGSQTNEWATPEEIQEHHRKFGVAVKNMIEKYRHLPYEQQHPALQPHLRVRA